MTKITSVKFSSLKPCDEIGEYISLAKISCYIVCYATAGKKWWPFLHECGSDIGVILITVGDSKERENSCHEVLSHWASGLFACVHLFCPLFFHPATSSLRTLMGNGLRTRNRQLGWKLTLWFQPLVQSLGTKMVSCSLQHMARIWPYQVLIQREGNVIVNTVCSCKFSSAAFERIC